MRRSLLLLPVILLLAGCTPTVALTPAPRATSAACANVIVRLPQTVAGLSRRNTDAQGTAAWGPDPAVTLVCGGSRTPSDRCGTVDDVDWTEQDETIGGRAATVLTTFGRDPVIQVVNPAATSANQGVSQIDVLNDVTEAVADGTRATGERCGATAPTTESPSPSP